ncbi:hypothetical protein D3P08_22820 [Paenibacillus nanensis]|uniref:Uncharacterized protein n=1 Tax=Paenibacillus nanensis TaxID=393251 RepID=A0A3A1UNJ8_9BACL|nr:hypothetical protein [Paenibacillus nanensis]RIX49386.1 hypothetical protein D3P08_22820 [Paenibacillus nanensis]
MEQGMTVVLLEKTASGALQQIEERTWSRTMITALEHVNYIVVGDREYETVEGRLNVDLGRLELLLVPIHS